MVNVETKNVDPVLAIRFFGWWCRGGHSILPTVVVYAMRGGGRGKTHQIIGGRSKNAREKSEITIAPSSPWRPLLYINNEPSLSGDSIDTFKYKKLFSESARSLARTFSLTLQECHLMIPARLYQILSLFNVSEIPLSLPHLHSDFFVCLFLLFFFSVLVYPTCQIASGQLCKTNWLPFFTEWTQLCRALFAARLLSDGNTNEQTIFKLAAICISRGGLSTNESKEKKTHRMTVINLRHCQQFVLWQFLVSQFSFFRPTWWKIIKQVHCVSTVSFPVSHSNAFYTQFASHCFCADIVLLYCCIVASELSLLICCFLPNKIFILRLKLKLYGENGRRL